MTAATVGRAPSRAPRPPGNEGPKRPRQAFTPQALRALDEFAAVLLGSGGVLDGVALELLLHFALSHLTEPERQALAGLDVRRAAGLFREQAARALDPRGGQGAPPPGGEATGDAPFRLPPQLAASEDLTYRARSSAAPAEFPFDGVPQYERLFDALARVLHRRQLHHVLLAGERGVGKSTVVAELARRAAAGSIPFLARARFLSVDCRYVSPDESRQRLAALLAHVADRPDLVVCVDGFAPLLRGERAASNKPVLLASLAHARCRVVGLLTPRECDEVASDDPDFAEFFTRVDVEEPDPDTALRLLRHFALGLADRFRVAIDGEAVRQAVALSANYVLNDQLPAKALKLLARACEEVDYERTQLGRPRDRARHGRRHGAAGGRGQRRAGGDAARRGRTVRLRAEPEGGDLRSGPRRPRGGDRAGPHQGRHDRPRQAGLRHAVPGPDRHRQDGAGQGPGAVLLDLQAAEDVHAGQRCVRAATTIAGIIGVPPGYVGHDQGGRLVNELNADPYCVFLLDEADKAHPDVLQPFLNLFDEGWVCDQRGVRAYGNKSIFILTSNVGQRMIADMVRQGKSNEEITGRMKEALSQIRRQPSGPAGVHAAVPGPPRRIIVFNPLDRAAMEAIARKLLAETAEAWEAKRGKRLVLPEGLAAYVGERGHQLNEQSAGKEGGRIVRKLLSEWVESRLQRETSQRPEEYKRCRTVTLEFTPPA